MESRRRCKSQQASANLFNHQGRKRPVEDRGTHLRHSSSFYRPPSLRSASVEPDRPARRLSAYIIPAMNVSCDPTPSARCACSPCCCCDPDGCPPHAPAGDARAIVPRASRDLRSVRIVARVVRVWLGAARRARRWGGPRPAENAMLSVAAVVAHRIEVSHAPHALGLPRCWW